jgi:hypothetical protein
MMGIGSFSARGASQAKAATTPPKAQAPAERPAAGGAHRPGQEAPDHLHDSQPQAGGKWERRLGVAGNLAMAGSMIYPMVQDQMQKKDQQAQPQNGEPKIQDKELYNQMSVSTAVGPTPINW